MTFDDGPHPSLTPALLDTLKARDIRATFFVIGSMAARYPDVIRRMADEGHETGNRTWSHAFLKSHDDEAILDEIDRTAALVENPHRPALPRFCGRPMGRSRPGNATWCTRRAVC
jgi:peptidoglycan/xylan/chitin deacetylase (PgdA/CDA1 family)